MKLKLILRDGTTFTGESFGYKPEDPSFFVDGEVVFNTSMVGYPETFTDPSYRGQILVLTYPMIGNYGVPSEEALAKDLSRLLESKEIHLRGLVVNEYSAEYSHWQAKKSLADFLKAHRIPALAGVDTRALTQKLREHGVMLGKIAAPGVRYDKKMTFADPNAENLVAEVSPKKKEIYLPQGEVKGTVAVIDCGAKHNIIRSFLERGLKVIRLPWDCDLKKLTDAYDGVFVSNGPGDPKMADKTIEATRWAMENGKVVFGICLGCQIMALAAGANTYKLKYGHRSANQPCVEEGTGRCHITSQNHGFAVDANTLPAGWEVWMTNANDGTVEGIKHKTRPWFSVQFHPEASPGPEDPKFLFDEFVKSLAKA